MNLGQTMITAGMLVLLIMSVVSANRVLLENTEATLGAEACFESGTIANDLLQEAMSKKFDEKADLTGLQDTTAFSVSDGGGWAPGKGEHFTLPDISDVGNFNSIAKYDDFDDYDGYSRLVTAKNVDSLFSATVTVNYVFAAEPTVSTHTRTYYKVIEISITHPLYLKTPVKVTGMMSY